jgi:hypothetical protein
VQEIVSVTYVESATGLEVLLPRAAVLRVRGGVRVIVPDGVSLPTAYVMRFVAGSGRYAAGDMDLSPGTNTITRVTGSFVADGFVVGDTIYTSRQNNRGPFTVQAVDALTLTTVENLSGPPGEEATLIASASGVPEALRVGLLAFTAWLYEHRGDELAPVPAHIDRLVRIYGVPETP